MNARQQNILEAVIREYQKTGQPVASQILVENYNFDLSPATMRAEMLALDKEGLLKQPHHSSGRVPTTEAFRLFVNSLLAGREFGARDEEKIKKNLQQIDGDNIFPQQVAQILADFSHNLGLSGIMGEKTDFHEAGFSSLLQDEELAQPESIANILKGFDLLEKRFIDFFEQLDKETEIFIGEENPIEDFKRCSLVISGYKLGGRKGFVGILGPKRMNYARNIFLVEETKKMIKNG